MAGSVCCVLHKLWLLLKVLPSFCATKDFEELSEEEEEEEQEVDRPEVKLPVKRTARAHVEIEYETEKETPVRQKVKT